MSDKAMDRRVARRRRRAVVSILRTHVGTGAMLVGGGPAVEAAKHEINRAMARHLTLWLEDLIPPEGATFAELREITGAGKKALRRRLLELEMQGQVRVADRHFDGLPRRYFRSDGL